MKNSLKQQSNSFEYSPNWTYTTLKTRRLQPFCTNNPFHGKASVVHHLKYRRSLFRRVLGLLLLHKPCKSVSGFEIPGYDVITVCKHCHANSYGYGTHKRSLHYKTVWIKGKYERGVVSKDDGLNNRQVWWKALELRIKFWMLATVLRIWYCFVDR